MMPGEIEKLSMCVTLCVWFLSVNILKYRSGLHRTICTALLPLLTAFGSKKKCINLIQIIYIFINVFVM